MSYLIAQLAVVIISFKMPTIITPFIDGLDSKEQVVLAERSDECDGRGCGRG
jgi:hypothetical protein